MDPLLQGGLWLGDRLAEGDRLVEVAPSVGRWAEVAPSVDL